MKHGPTHAANQHAGAHVTRETFSSLSPSGSAQRVEHVLDQHRATLQTMFPIPPARSRNTIRCVGAGSVIAALLGLCLWLGNPAYRTEAWTADIGQPRTITLADGSLLTLDTASSVQIKWRLRSRDVALHQGRAHFDVVATKWRPFAVVANNIAVRVVGTRFDVWKQAAQTIVTVQEGSVAVGAAEVSASPDEQAIIRLHTGQQLFVPAAYFPGVQEMQPHSINIASSSAWQKGQLIFDNTPLLEVIGQIQRYRSMPIKVLGLPGHSAMPVSGVFSTDNTDELLDQLAQILPVQVQRHADGRTEIRLR